MDFDCRARCRRRRKKGGVVDDYITMREGVEATGEFVDRKSRFIAQLVHVESEDEANAHIAAVRARHYDARHNVPAWILLDGRERQSDDGEPQRTSGMPTLEVLRGAGLKNVCCVTTRYFGGTLLGTGGLVRAYGGAAALALESGRHPGQLKDEVCSPAGSTIARAVSALRPGTASGGGFRLQNRGHRLHGYRVAAPGVQSGGAGGVFGSAHRAYGRSRRRERWRGALRRVLGPRGLRSPKERFPKRHGAKERGGEGRYRASASCAPCSTRISTARSIASSMQPGQLRRAPASVPMPLSLRHTVEPLAPAKRALSSRESL